MDPQQIVIDPCTGRPILVAPNRRDRPIHTVPDHAHGACPFCPGQEHQTPPERDAIRTAGAADAPGWRVRAFENRYPATAWHEVFAEGPEHLTQPGALDTDLWCDVLALHRRRAMFFEAQRGVRCAFLFKNVGLLAGASIAHNHSQMLGLPMLPPRLDLELERQHRNGCEICRQLESAERDARLVARGAHHSILVPREPKLPHETWLVPHDHAADWLAPRSREIARDEAEVLRKLYRAVATAFGDPPFNSWLHRVPGADFHWHVELQPRTGHLAALELGGDMYINAVTAEAAAARLRSGLVGP